MERLTITVEGGQEISILFNRITERINDLRPAWEMVADQLMTDIEKEFSTHGAYAGNPWAPLKASTIKQKQRKCPGNVSNILVCTGRMKQSLIQRGGENITDINPDHLVFGTQVPYAIYHQFGTKYMPARKPLYFSRYTAEAIGRLIQWYIWGKYG